MLQLVLRFFGETLQIALAPIERFPPRHGNTLHQSAIALAGLQPPRVPVLLVLSTCFGILDRRDRSTHCNELAESDHLLAKRNSCRNPPQVLTFLSNDSTYRRGLKRCERRRHLNEVASRIQRNAC